MSRKHYKAIAEIINRNSNKAYQTTHTKNLVIALSNYFEQDNPRFDRQKFLEVCSIEK